MILGEKRLNSRWLNCILDTFLKTNLKKEIQMFPGRLTSKFKCLTFRAPVVQLVQPSFPKSPKDACCQWRGEATDQEEGQPGWSVSCLWALLLLLLLCNWEKRRVWKFTLWSACCRWPRGEGSNQGSFMHRCSLPRYVGLFDQIFKFLRENFSQLSPGLLIAFLVAWAGTRERKTGQRPKSKSSFVCIIALHCIGVDILTIMETLLCRHWCLGVSVWRSRQAAFPNELIWANLRPGKLSSPYHTIMTVPAPYLHHNTTMHSSHHLDITI